jgi:hypothetical protein
MSIPLQGKEAAIFTRKSAWVVRRYRVDAVPGFDSTVSTLSEAVLL